ncbi:MAG: hypothetical protein QOE70_4904 [Chthoniobacter sp.]|nr:hypothetical protein [Chthoniobacter sp.]
MKSLIIIALVAVAFGLGACASKQESTTSASTTATHGYSK